MGLNSICWYIVSIIVFRFFSPVDDAWDPNADTCDRHWLAGGVATVATVSSIAERFDSELSLFEMTPEFSLPETSEIARFCVFAGV
jgi:hypothetical protein